MSKTKSAATRPARAPKSILNAHIPWAELKPEHFSYVPCPICGVFDYKAKASLVINWCEFFIVQCAHCGLMWRNPMPDSGFLMDLYAEEYFNVRQYAQDLVVQVGIPDADEYDQNKRREITQKGVQDWIKVVKITPKDANGNSRKLLEIGGGRGYLQRAATEAGFVTLGLEISPHGIKEAIRRDMMVLPIVLDEFCSKYVPYRRFFDLVAFFDFLEHVTDPGRILRMVRSLMKDDGYGVLRIPCIAGDDCPQYHLIDHIWHFSEDTIETLLAKEGFTIHHKQESGRFPTPSGQINNLVLFIKKAEG